MPSIEEDVNMILGPEPASTSTSHGGEAVADVHMADIPDDAVITAGGTILVPTEALLRAFANGFNSTLDIDICSRRPNPFTCTKATNIQAWIG